MRTSMSTQTVFLPFTSYCFGTVFAWWSWLSRRIKVKCALAEPGRWPIAWSECHAAVSIWTALSSFFWPGFVFFWFLVLCFHCFSTFPASLLFCSLLFLLLCFSTCILLLCFHCFSAYLLLCFSAFCISCLCAFRIVFFFSAFLLFAFPASLLFALFSSSVLLLLLCFSAFCFSCLCAFRIVFFFSAFIAYLLFAFPASLLFELFSSSLLSLLLCFSASLLFCFCAFLLLLFYFFFFSHVFCCSTFCSFASLLPVFTVSLFFISFALFSPVCIPS